MFESLARAFYDPVGRVEENASSTAGPSPTPCFSRSNHKFSYVTNVLSARIRGKQESRPLEENPAIVCLTSLFQGSLGDSNIDMMECGTILSNDQITATERDFQTKLVSRKDVNSFAAICKTSNVYWNVISQGSSENDGNLPQAKANSALATLNDDFAGSAFTFVGQWLRL
ncbi:hypothetical protein ACEPAI_4551 [Sanghuangporus weigelae]